MIVIVIIDHINITNQGIMCSCFRWKAFDTEFALVYYQISYFGSQGHTYCFRTTNSKKKVHVNEHL